MRLGKYTGITLACFGLLDPGVSLAVFPPPTTNHAALAYWRFDDTNWLHDVSYAPVSFTNLINFTNFGNGNCLLLDSTNAAWLQYNLIENDGTTNLTVDTGTLSIWFAPNWSGTNEGGLGPGEWGRLIEVGSYTMDASYGWFSLYVDPEGVNIYFSAQGNDGSETDLSAPIDWQTNQWHNITLTYSPTNGAATNLVLYLDGMPATNGPGLASWPGPDVRTNGFYVGSDSNGTAQAHGYFDDLHTYNFPRDAATIRILNGMFFPAYYGSQSTAHILSATSSPSTTPNFNAVTGPGHLTGVTNNTAPCITTNCVWITDVKAVATNGTMNLTFSITGGQGGVLYDVYANTVLDFSTNTATAWAWMGQGYHCYTYTITNLPSSGPVFLILGTPFDADGDGLTTAYEFFVSKTDPNKADTSGDGMLDGWKVLWGLNSSLNNPAQPSERSNYTYDQVGWLDLLSGIRSETLTNDFEGNLLQAH